MGNRNNTNSNLSVSKGGVSLEIGRGYRGTLNVNGKRHRTARYDTRKAAVRALNTMRRELLASLN